jgi:hypothetical protein
MKTSVEAVAEVGIKKGRTAGVAFRQPDQSPIHLLVIDPNCLMPSARSIVARILEIERSRGVGAYLFVNDALQAFVITEEKPLALQWAKARFRELVGYYRTVRPADRRIPTLAPIATGLVEDLTEHLADLQRVPA